MKKWSIIIISGLLLAVAAQARAVDYELPDLDDQQQSLDQYRGKWVIVNYWATWCELCKIELPHLASLHESNRVGDVVVVGINFESINAKTLMTFVADNAIPYPVLRSEPIPRTPLGLVPALPTTYIIDPNGEIVAGEVGLVTRENLEEFIAKRSSTNQNDPSKS
jgi:thiol-disulfide isomerase/thioredoxin